MREQVSAKVDDARRRPPAVAHGAVQHQPLLAIAEIKDGIGAIRAMHDRMQSITDRIDRMSAAQRDPVPTAELKAGLSIMRAVQDRVQALNERFDEITPMASGAAAGSAGGAGSAAGATRAGPSVTGVSARAGVASTGRSMTKDAPPPGDGS